MRRHLGFHGWQLFHSSQFVNVTNKMAAQRKSDVL